MSEVKRVFITGASGFLGSRLLSDFAERGFESYVLVRDRNNFAKHFTSSRVNVLEGDMETIGKHPKELSSCNYFVHLAGEKRDTTKMRQTNVDSLKIILEEVIKHPHLNFMLMSSAGVYGIRKNPSRVLDEKVICHPENLYEQTKLEAENLLKEFAKTHPVNYVILRPTNIFGEQDPDRKFLNLMRALQKGNVFLINSRAISNYVSARFVSEAVIQIINAPKFTNEIYNVNLPVFLSDFISILKSALGVHSQTRYLPAWVAYPLAILGDLLPRKIQFFNPDKYFELTNEKIITIEKLKKIIPVDEKQMLSDALKKLAAHYKFNHWL